MGEAASLACAVLWASSTVAMRSQTGRIPVVALNAIRALYASVVYLLALALLGKLDEILRVPVDALAGLLGSVLIGMAIGDSMHIRAMSLIGVSRSMPISSTYPIWTAIIAVIWLDEPITVWTASGIALVVAGVFLVAFPRGAKATSTVDGRSVRLGIALAFGASACWALSTVIVKPAMSSVDPLVANGLRLPVALVVLFAMSFFAGGPVNPLGFGRKVALILLAAGILSGLSGAFWLIGVRDAGAAKAAALSSTAPIFAAPLAALTVGEKMTRETILGTLLTVVGVWLVM